MRRAYPFHEIEPKWQRYWEEEKTFRTPDEIDTSKPKFYVLDMFPYPRSVFSSSWIHICAKRLNFEFITCYLIPASPALSFYSPL